MCCFMWFFFLYRFTGIKQKTKSFTFSWNPCTKFSIPKDCNDVLVSWCYCYTCFKCELYFYCECWVVWNYLKFNFYEFSYFSSPITINFTSSKLTVGSDFFLGAFVGLIYIVKNWLGLKGQPPAYATPGEPTFHTFPYKMWRSIDNLDINSCLS